MDNGSATAWLPLATAAQRLNTTVDALRKRARRGLVESRKDNHGRLMVLVSDLDMASQEPDNLDELADLKLEVERWRSLAEERGLELARAEAKAETAKAVAAADVAAARAELTAISFYVAQLEGMLAAARRPWWHKLLG